MKRTKRRIVTEAGPHPPVLGIGWYAPEQYARLREAFADKNNFHERWSQWEAKATETFELLRAQGVAARKIAIDVEEMIAWCQEHGKPLDAASRAEFIAIKSRELGIAEAKQQKG
jgi:hypothetical protein